MSKLSRNQLLSRRGFIRSGARGVEWLAAGSAFATVSSRFAVVESGAPGANRLTYDAAPLRKTDPKLIQYEQVGVYPLRRKEARRVAIGPDDHLFIAAGNRVIEIEGNGTPGPELILNSPARCLAIAADGALYLGLRDHVEIHDRNGQCLASWDSPGKQPFFTGLAIGENDVFLADAGNRIVWRYDKSGKLAGRIGEKNPARNIPGFIVPSPFFDVELARDGLLRVTNPGRHRVEIYTVDGDLEFAWGNPSMAITGFCGCCNPINLALLPDGRCVTFEKGLPRAKVYSPTGAFESVVAGAEAFMENAKACGPDSCSLGGLDGVVDSQGRILILDLVAGNVRVMQRKQDHELPGESNSAAQ